MNWNFIKNSDIIFIWWDVFPILPPPSLFKGKAGWYKSKLLVQTNDDVPLETCRCCCHDRGTCHFCCRYSPRQWRHSWSYQTLPQSLLRELRLLRWSLRYICKHSLQSYTSHCKLNLLSRRSVFDESRRSAAIAVAFRHKVNCSCVFIPISVLETPKFTFI